MNESALWSRNIRRPFKLIYTLYLTIPVERSHRNDQERFYNHLSFYSYNDLLYQMSNYLYRSNRIPSRVLGWLTPEEMTKKLMPISSPRKASKLPENIMDFIYGDVSV